MAIMRSLASLSLRWRVRPATLRLLTFLLLLVAAKSVVTWWRWTDGVALSIEQTNRTTATDEAIIKAFPARADTIVRTKQELLAASDSFVFAPTVAQATTVTASLIAREAASAGVRLGTIDIRSDSTLHNGVRMTTVEGEASGAFAGAIAFVRELDRGSPFFVRRLTLSPVSAIGAPSQLMRVRFAVVALARRPFGFER